MSIPPVFIGSVDNVCECIRTLSEWRACGKSIAPLKWGGEMPPSSLVFARGYAIAYEFAYAKAFQ